MARKDGADSAWEDIEPLLDELLDLEPGSQSRYIDELSGTDAELAARLAALLGADEPDDDMRKRLDPLMERALDALEGSASIDERIGPWKVEETIGRGGMGVVVRAVRADGQFRQTVALKVMSERIGDRLARRRFLNERQILARLTHPNVAQLVDGGVLDDGRPYFAMELVRGAPILEFADEHRLNLSQRIELLVQLCRGVEYAHRNLVIHRDIKPSNILVTRTSFGTGEPTDSGGETGSEAALNLVKLLDFGIAKMTDPESTTTLQTIGGLRPMTFEYASPEQIRGDDVTVASDLYSLALIAYELICGVPPISVRSESLSSIARVARDDNPAPRASVRYAGLAVADQERIAHQRSTKRAALIKVLRSDLDHVFERCLRKRPENRYESVAQLRRELERFLEGLPVAARRGSTRYRLSKLIARNRWAAAAASAVVLALLAGLVGILWQAAATARERDRALTAEQRSSALNRFLLEDLLGSASPEVARGREVTLLQVLDEGANRVAQQFADAPEIDTEIQGTLGDVYLQLGRTDQARVHLERSLAAADRTTSVEAKGVAQQRMARLATVTGQQAEAVERLEEAVTRLSVEPGPDALATLLAEAKLARAMVLTQERERGLNQLQETLDAIERRYPEAWRERLTVRRDLLASYVEVRRAQEAERLAAEILELQEEHLGPKHPGLIPTLRALARAQLREYRPEEALQSLERATALTLELKGERAPELLDLARDRIQVARPLGRHLERVDLAREALSMTRAAEGSSANTARAINMLGVCLGDIGRNEEAISYYREAGELFLRHSGEGSASYLRTQRNIVSSYETLVETQPNRRRNLDRAIEALLTLERRVSESQQLDPTLLADISNDFVWRGRNRADYEYALELAQRAVDASGRSHWEALQSLGRSLAALGRYQEADEANLEALAMPGALKSRGLVRDIPRLYREMGTPERILPLFRSLADRRSAELSPNDPSIGDLLLEIARLEREFESPEAAIETYRQTIAQLEMTKDHLYARLLAARSELGALLLETGDLAAARPLIEQSFERMLGQYYLDRSLQDAVAERAIALYREVGEPARARQIERALPVWRRLPVDGAWTWGNSEA